MKITEKMLLDGYTGLSNGLHLMSLVKGETIHWHYREGRDGDGFNCVTSRSSAREISLEVSRYGTIMLEESNDNHPSIAKHESDYAKANGDEI